MHLGNANLASGVLGQITPYTEGYCKLPNQMQKQIYLICYDFCVAPAFEKVTSVHAISFNHILTMDNQSIFWSFTQDNHL